MVTDDEPKVNTTPVASSHCTRLADPVVSAQFRFTASPTEYIPNRLSPENDITTNLSPELSS